VLECVGTEQAIDTAIEIARPGGAVGRVGVPHYPGVPPESTFYTNVVVGGGPAPVRAYIDELSHTVKRANASSRRIGYRHADRSGRRFLRRALS
jgi:threonine dehydrogenase-like Zn-dependent dehydrogenase